MFRIYFARIILAIDNRFHFIDEKHVFKVRAVYENILANGFRKSRPKISQQIAKSGFETSNREYYALFLFWKGVLPSPRLENVPKKKLHGIPFLKRIGIKLFILTIKVLNRINGLKLEIEYQISIETISNDLNFLEDEVAFDENLKAVSETMMIVVPVFNAFDSVVACLKSVIETTRGLGVDILVINDASTDPRVDPYLHDLVLEGAIRLVKNDENLGFARTANVGLFERDDVGVLLLNSDTVVFDGWIDEFNRIANLDSSIGTITAMSNAATIYSLPFGAEFECEVDFARTIAGIISNQNLVDAIDIPTCHGFCVYISRGALSDCGGFDSDTFGFGYGEENDFSRRIVKKGYRNVLATRVLIYHEGSASFGLARKQQANSNMDKLLSRYPDFLQLVSKFVAEKQLERLRIALLIQLAKESKIRPTVYVTHNLGGGVMKSIEVEIAESGGFGFILIPNNDKTITLRIDINRNNYLIQIALEELFLEKLLELLNNPRLVIHHLLNMPGSIIREIEQSKIDFELRLHDYYYICPRFHLQGKDNNYCGLPEESECTNCLNGSGIDIVDWRVKNQAVLLSGATITAPTKSVVNLYNKIYPLMPIAIQKFEPKEIPLIPQISRNSFREKLIIGIVGDLSGHKGYELVEAILLNVNFKEIDIEFVVFGQRPTLMTTKSKRISFIGAYSSTNELYSNMEKNPIDLFLIPGRIPETYSYTATEIMGTGLPVAYFKIGALPERFADYKRSRALSLQLTIQEIITELLQLKKDEINEK